MTRWRLCTCQLGQLGRRVYRRRDRPEAGGRVVGRDAVSDGWERIMHNRRPQRPRTDWLTCIPTRHANSRLLLDSRLPSDWLVQSTPAESTPTQLVPQLKCPTTVWPLIVDRIMNGDFLRPVQWYILYCMTPPGHLFTMDDTHTTVYTAPRHLESWRQFNILAIYQYKPRTDTVWGHYSDTCCCLTPTGYFSTYGHGRRSTTDHKALQHLENQYCYE